MAPLNNYPFGLQTIHFKHKDHSAPVFSVSNSPGSKFYATGSNDGSIKIYDGKKNDIIHDFKGVGNISALQYYNNDDSKMVSVGWNGQIKIWYTDIIKTK